MTRIKLKTAIDILKKQVNDIPIIGYWDLPEGIVLCIDSSNIDANLCIPGQYMVTNDGDVIPTNPMRYDIPVEAMKKL